MSQITLRELALGFLEEGEYDDKEVDFVVTRAQKRIPAPFIQEALEWLPANPIKDPSGKSSDEYSWPLYCVSGYSMPDHPWVGDMPDNVRFVLDRIFMWLCVTPDLCQGVQVKPSTLRHLYRPFA